MQRPTRQPEFDEPVAAPTGGIQADDPDVELEPAPADLRCAHCEAELATTEDLDAHLRQAHGLPGVGVARCPVCDLEFGTADELALHRREAHPG